MADKAGDVTLLLQRAGDGDQLAIEQLLPLVYDDLRKAAQLRMVSERSDHTLQATALVHEAYLRLVGERQIPWQNRAHFYVAAAEAMRRILLDHAKSKNRVKRGGGMERVPLHIADIADTWDSEKIMSLDDAIRRLIDLEPKIGEIVRLRFYAGLSIEQTAEVMGISRSTVKRWWEFGRTWLFRELTRGES